MSIYLIIDVDKTLADHSHRDHLVKCENPDWQKFLSPELVAKDAPVKEAQRAFKYLEKSEILFLTARNEGLRQVTSAWLLEYFNVWTGNHNLIMQPVGNTQKPTEFKESVLKGLCRSEYEFLQGIAIDDNLFMTSVYKKYGLIPLIAPECWKYIGHDKQMGLEPHWYL